MQRAFLTARLIMLGLFAVAVAAIWGYQMLYAAPKQRCEQAGMWWASKWRACAAPVDVTKLTGRPLTPPPQTAPAPKTAAAP